MLNKEPRGNLLLPLICSERQFSARRIKADVRPRFTFKFVSWMASDIDRMNELNVVFLFWKMKTIILVRFIEKKS